MELASAHGLVFVDIMDQLMEDVVETEGMTHRDDTAINGPKLVYFYELSR
jgi:hypothetical protein